MKEVKITNPSHPHYKAIGIVVAENERTNAGTFDKIEIIHPENSGQCYALKSDYKETPKMKPITQTEYRKNPERFWKGKRVKALRELRNGYWAIPEGFVLAITRKYCGFDLKAVDECPHCGVGKVLTIGRVNPEALELLP